MSFSHPSWRPSSRTTLLAAVGTVLVGGWCLAPEAHTQAPAAPVSAAALAATVAKLKSQQTLIVANQAKIEAQTALLKEELRQSKIYSARGGSGRR